MMAVYRGVAEKLVERYEHNWYNNVRLKETCICSVEMLIANSVNICVVVLVALALKIPREVLVFFATFAGLRYYAGGVHAKNYFQCITIYLSILLTSIYCVKQCIHLTDLVIYFLCIVSMILAAVMNYKYAAKQNGRKNKIADYRRKTYYVLSVIESVMIIFGVTFPYIKNEMLQDMMKETMLIQVCALLTHSVSLYLSNRKKEVQNY